MTDLARTWAGSRLALGDPRYREPYQRVLGAANNIPLTSGQMLLTGIDLYAGDVINALTFLSGTTALTMGSNGDGRLWFALYGPDLRLLGQSADQGGAATWPASTQKTLPLGVAAAQTGWHYAAVMVNAGTGGAPVTPTVRGINVIATQISGETGWPPGVKTLAGTSGAGLGAVAPAGPVTLAATVNVMYCVAS
jgi:hypothetical protein